MSGYQLHGNFFVLSMSKINNLFERSLKSVPKEARDV